MSAGWVRESGRPNIHLHWAVNGVRNRWRLRRGAKSRTLPDLGTYEETVGWAEDVYEVRVLRAPFPYVAPSTCRIERDDWHNRVHRATIRIIAEGPAGRMEYGFGACGSALVDPLYLREGERTCSCGNGDGTPCPRCEAIA